VATVEAEVEEVAAAVSEAEEVTEEVATVEAAVAGRGTSVGLAEEPVVAEDAEPNLAAFAILPHFRAYSLGSVFGHLDFGRFVLGFPLESLPETLGIVS